jgi:two-component system OmpR family sensor kinase
VAGWGKVSLRAKLTALSVAIIGVLLIISSLGTVALLRTYLQATTDNVLLKTAQTLRFEDPTLIRARIATRQLQLPALPSDYYIAFLDSTGQFQLGIEQSTKPNATVPNLSSLDVAAVQNTMAPRSR